MSNAAACREVVAINDSLGMQNYHNHADHLRALFSGSDRALLQECSLYLPAAHMGLVYGRSGAGKSTLLQVRDSVEGTPSRATSQLACMMANDKPRILLSSASRAADASSPKRRAKSQ